MKPICAGDTRDLLTDCYSNASGYPRAPWSPNRQSSRKGGHGEENSSAGCPFLGHIWQALPCYKPSCEYPDVGCWNLEKFAGNLVHSAASNDISQWKGAIYRETPKSTNDVSDLRCVNAICKSREHGAKSSAYELSPELCFGSSSKKMASLQILHQVARL